MLAIWPPEFQTEYVPPHWEEEEEEVRRRRRRGGGGEGGEGGRGGVGPQPGKLINNQISRRHLAGSSELRRI